MIRGVQWVGRLLHRCIPPSGSSDPEAEYAWRLSVFAVLLVVTVLVTVNTLHTFYAHGLLPGGDGFTTRNEVREVHLAVLRPELRELRKQHCRAINEGNRRAVEYTFRELEEKSRQYLKLTGRVHTVPDCIALGVLPDASSSSLILLLDPFRDL